MMNSYPGATLIIDVSEIDTLLDEGVDIKLLDGQLLRWHDEQLCPLTIHHGRLVAKLVVTCWRCKIHQEIVEIGSGLHNGAWVYVFNEHGEYQACLRDQNYVCEWCAANGKEN